MAVPGPTINSFRWTRESCRSTRTGDAPTGIPAKKRKRSSAPSARIGGWAPHTLEEGVGTGVICLGSGVRGFVAF